MEDGREYVIKVDFNRFDSDGYQSPYSAPAPTQPSGSTGVANAAGLVSNLKAFSKVVPAASLIKRTFSYNVSLVGRYTGSQDAQEKANAAMSIVQQVGGVTGAFAIGGLAAGLLSLGSVGLGYLFEAGQREYERNWENISLMLSRERAGASYNRSRLE